MDAFKAFKQRHSKTNNNDDMNNNDDKNNNVMKNKKKKDYINNCNGDFASIPCTPLTDDFENCILESERKTKQRKKKFQFKSRQNKKQLLSPSIYNHALSPIPDISPAPDVSMSTSFNNSFNGPPITPNNNNNNNKNNNSFMMNLSGISDISSIDTMNDRQLSPEKDGFKSPELPPSTPLTLENIKNSLNRKPQRFSPISALKSKPAKRFKKSKDINKNNNNIDYITKEVDNINIDTKGSMVRMELISLSPSKRNKYGSNKVLSPVRRSKRNNNKNNNKKDKKLNQLLKESNFTFKPNPNISNL